MNTVISRNLNWLFILFAAFNLFFQFGMIIFLGDKAIYALISINILYLLVFLNVAYLKDNITTLFILNMFPLIYFDIEFHYTLKPILLQDIPIFIILVLAFFSTLKNGAELTYKLTYLRIPVIIFTFYSFIMFANGYLIQKFPLSTIILEYIHILYYSLAIFYSITISKRKTYHRIFTVIAIIYCFIAIEYILFTFLISDRVVTFQAYISPIIISSLFSLWLLTKKKAKWVFLFSIIFSGMMITLTRTLWVAIFISLGTVIYFYLVDKINMSKIKVIMMSVIVAMVFLFLITSVKTRKVDQSNLNDAKYRTQSMAKNPTEDHSFLMRLELGYYLVQEFMQSPITGSGLGATVYYQVTGDTEDAVLYPDNSWLYFLWKGGVIGFLLFVWIYWRAIRASYFIYKNSDDQFSKALCLGIFAGLMGLIPFGLFNAVLIKYQTTLILGFLLAYLDYERTALVQNLSKLRIEKSE